jgi:iron complex transport system permease protein
MQTVAAPAPPQQPSVRPSARRIDRRPLVLAGAALLLVAAVVIGVSIGSVRVPIRDVLETLAGEHTGGNHYIIWRLRLPRVLLAALVGINLGLAGALLQSLTRNPLAEPNLLGISGGGALAAVLALKLHPQMQTEFGQLSLLAFAGSLVGAALVYGLAWRGGVSPLRLVLAGVAVGALFTALTTGVLLTSSITLQTTMSWLAGGLSARTWTHFWTAARLSVVGIVAALALARPLDVLALGDDSATALGLPVQWVRAGFTAIVALLTGAAVAVAGVIGFVGLIVPHLARMLVGPRHVYLLPVSALFGGTLMVAADAIARTIAAPRELPIGIVTAVAGAPFFLWLLRRAV